MIGATINEHPDRLEGPSPATQVALDMAKRSVFLLPLVILFGAALDGTEGALSVAYALAIVVINFVLAAFVIGRAAQISFALVFGAALGGFAFRLGLIFLAILAVAGQEWVRIVPMGITLIVTHLGLLVWELRYVSASMAYPGLKPKEHRQGVREPVRS
ncbi:MAG: ATP synthase subunit I [Acidimicrobiales bacterium]|nr:ATP synthase subunit I [Acidimicrobiales bacterium]